LNKILINENNRFFCSLRLREEELNEVLFLFYLTCSDLIAVE